MKKQTRRQRNLAKALKNKFRKTIFVIKHGRIFASLADGRIKDLEVKGRAYKEDRYDPYFYLNVFNDLGRILQVILNNPAIKKEQVHILIPRSAAQLCYRYLTTDPGFESFNRNNQGLIGIHAPSMQVDKLHGCSIHWIGAPGKILIWDDPGLLPIQCIEITSVEFTEIESTMTTKEKPAKVHPIKDRMGLQRLNGGK